MSRFALVTGGTDGIGAATAGALFIAGYHVVSTYGHNVEKAKVFTDATTIPTRQFDVADFDACQENVAAIEKEFGGVDVLVNNAGFAIDKQLHKMDAETWNRVIATNLTGCFNMTRAVINGMRDRKYGRIINISSLNGQTGQFGQSNYAASKAGIIGLTKCAALENASRGITVNAIAPGYTATEMMKAIPADIMKKIVDATPVGRLAETTEIARAVLFLADEQSGFITGITLSINGGRYFG